MTIAAALVLVSAGSVATAASRAFDIDIDETSARRASAVVVQQGDDVALRISSDKPVDVHLHGYDIAATASKAKPANLQFVARIAGRFPIEIHSSGRERVVAYVEVHPR